MYLLDKDDRLKYSINREFLNGSSINLSESDSDKETLNKIR